MTTKIIGICGKMGSGKDWFSKNYFPDAETVSFAEPLKHHVLATNPDIDKKDVYEKKTAHSRNVLRNTAEWFRTTFGKDYYIKLMEQRLGKGSPIYLITDVRYPNEVEFIKKKGGIIVEIVAPIGRAHV